MRTKPENKKTAFDLSFQDSLSSTTEGVLVLDNANTILYLNPIAKALLGLKPGQIMEIPYDAVLTTKTITWKRMPAKLLTFPNPKIKTESDLPENDAQIRLMTLLSNLPGIAYRCHNDPDRTMEFVSENCKDLTGYYPQDFISNKKISFSAIIHPDDRQKVWADTQSSLTQRKPFQLTYRIQTASGSIRWVWEQGRGIFRKNGNLEALEGFILDITERKQVEENLRLSEARFRAIVEDNAELICRCLQNGYLSFVNETFCHYFSKTRQELLGSPLLPLVYPEDRSLFTAFLKIANPDMPAFSLENRVLLTNGKIRWIQWTIHSIRDDEGNFLEYQGVGQDITEVKIARAAEEESGQRLRDVMANVKLAAIILDQQGNVAFSNPYLLELSGLNQNQLIGKNWFDDLLPKDVGQKFKQLFLEAAFTGTYPERYEHVIPTQNGDVRLIAWNNTLLRNSLGDFSGIASLGEDITDRKLREQELESIARITTACQAAVSRAEILPLVIDHVVAQFEATAATIVTVIDENELLQIDLGAGLWKNLTGHTMHIGEGISSQVYISGGPYINNNASKDPYFVAPALLQKIKALVAAPFSSQGKIRGILTLGREKPFLDQELRLLMSICNIAASAIHRADLYDQTVQQAVELTQAYDATIEGWAHALELRDKETRGHTLRVTNLAMKLAKKIGIQGAALDDMRRGVVLHDIGKMGIPDGILLKPGELLPEEQSIMHRHPGYAIEMLSPITYLKNALDIPLHHHERWDGSGYPHGLKGTEIPLTARIFAVVDVWDALTSDRPYRPAWDREKTLVYIQNQSKHHFDPDVVEKFMELIKEEKF